MITEQQKKLIDKYLEGRTSKEEVEKIDSLFADNEDNVGLKELVLERYKHFFEGKAPEDYHLLHILDKVHHQINLERKNKLDLSNGNFFKWYKLVAAVLFIPLLIAGSLIFSKYYYGEEKSITESATQQTIFAPYGSRIKFSLPDGTEGWLNSGSSITYNLPFTTKRILSANGEVWLNVKKDNSHPFTVKGDKSTVTVLGTKFNFSDYPENNYTEVVLEEGSVQFYTPGISEAIKIKPNERLTLANNSINIEKTDVSKFVLWKEGKLVFRGDNMTEVTRRIERWYNVNVEIVDKELESYTFRGIFQDDSLEEVFRYLSMTSPMKYQIIGRKILDNGTIQKEKVLLFSKENF